MGGMNRFGKTLCASQLTPDEICTAAACMGYHWAPGLRADLLEQPGAQLRDAVLFTLRQLAKNNLVFCAVDKRPALDDKLRETVTTVCRPERVISARRVPLRGHADQVHVYIREGRACAMTGEGGVFEFENIASLQKELCRVFSCESFPAGLADITILYEELRYVRRLADSFQQSAAEVFIEKCVPRDEDRQLLMNLLTGKYGYMGLTCWERDGERYSTSRADTVLTGSSGLMHMTCTPQGEVRIRGVSSEKLRCRLEEYCGKSEGNP